MEADVATQKAALRAQMRARRAASGDVRADSAAAAARLAALPCFAAAAVVALYAGHGGELDPLALLALPAAAGKRFVLPRVLPGARLEWRALELAVVGEPEAWELARAALRRGAYGILEPEGPRRAPDEVSLWVVPGLAFDLRGGRLGSGGGYYDRALAGRDVPALGLCFDWQVVAEVPSQGHDLRVDGLITPSQARLWAACGGVEGSG